MRINLYRGASVKKMKPRLIAIFLVVAIVSAFFIVPRIVGHPNPEDPVRFHHHGGDGATELGVLAAHAQWRERGYASTGFLPCLSSPPADCVVYTHYPAGIYLLSSLLLRVSSVQAARFILYFLVTLLTALALYWLGEDLAFSLSSLIVGAAALALTRGFTLFADNLFGHGLVLALFGLGLALALRKRSSLLTYFSYSVVCACFTVELIPALLAFPFLNSFYLWQREERRCLKLLGAAIAAVVLVMGVRFLQNALYLGWSEAFADWWRIIAYRVLGGSIDPAVKTATYVQADAHFFSDYSAAWIDHQRVSVTKLGLALLWGTPLVCMVLKRWAELRLFLGVYFCSLLWTFLFVQHSMIHLFTFRYVVWPLALAVILLWSLASKMLAARHRILPIKRTHNSV